MDGECKDDGYRFAGGFSEVISGGTDKRIYKRRDN